MLMKETFSAAKPVGTVAHVSQKLRSVNALFMILSRRRSGSSSSSHRLKLDGQVVDFWLYALLVVAIANLDRVGVRACLEHDVVLLRQMFVHICGQIIEVPKRRHRPDGAVGKQRLELLFLTKRDSVADCFLGLLEINLAICWKHHHQML